VRTKRVEQWSDLASVIADLDLPRSVPTLVILGGAGSLTGHDAELLEPLFAELAATAERVGAAVVDGGTDRGVMRLLGRAHGGEHDSPLLGVAVAELVAPPGAADDSRCPLEPNHTHVLLVPGTEWGEEVPWLARVATMLADGAPSVTVLVNGGEISYDDVEASITEGRPVLVAAGSGGTADELAAAARGEAADDRARALAGSELVRVVDFGKDSGLTTEIERILSERS
jgi:hypothetical protein